MATLAMAVAAIAVTFRLYDPDLWQHLAVGRWLWEQRELPASHLWSWPTYGAPGTTPSWLFRVLLWPFAAIDPLWGTQAWRWGTALLTVGLVWVAARARGSREGSLLPWVAIAACLLVFRDRSQARPETLVAVLLAAQLALLEWWRERGDRRLVGVPLVTWIWSNAHLSGFLSPLVTLAYLVDSLLNRQRRPGDRRALSWTMLACVGAWLLHPYGPEAWGEAFRFLGEQRGEAVFRGIGELRPVQWSEHLRDGLPVLLLVMVLALIHRARTRGVDWAVTSIALVATGVALSSQRFLGLWAVVASFVLAREAGAWAVEHRRGPRAAALRTALATLALVCIAALAVTDPVRPFGVGLDPTRAPRAALDAMSRLDVAGRGFAPFHFAGHLLWRFPGDSGRLPFMDIHQSGTPDLRAGYVRAFTSSDGWHELDSAHRFDWVLLDRFQAPGDDLADRLDTHRDWSLIFMDDAAALWVRRDGADSSLARRRSLGLPAGQRNLASMLSDPSSWADRAPRLQAECETLVTNSPQHRQALALLALTSLVAGDVDRARSAAARGLREYPQDPLIRRLSEAIAAPR